MDPSLLMGRGRGLMMTISSGSLNSGCSKRRTGSELSSDVTALCPMGGRLRASKGHSSATTITVGFQGALIAVDQRQLHVRHRIHTIAPVVVELLHEPEVVAFENPGLQLAAVGDASAKPAQHVTDLARRWKLSWRGWAELAERSAKPRVAALRDVV